MKERRKKERSPGKCRKKEIQIERSAGKKRLQSPSSISMKTGLDHRERERDRKREILRYGIKIASMWITQAIKWSL